MQALPHGNHVSRVINSLETAELIASRTILHPGQYNGFLHYHDNAHFSFVLQGGCSEKKKAHYERRPGSVTWYEAGELHQIMQVTAPSYHVNFELPEAFFNNYDISPEMIGRAIEQHPGIRPLMLKVYRELDGPDNDSTLSLEQLLLNQIQEAACLLKPGIPAWVNKLRELLADRWNETLSLQELSQSCGMHPVTISKYFPAYFSCTLGEYRRRLKINGAIARMHRSLNSSLSSLAYDCGFADESHFIRTFKEVTGMRPALFRTRMARME
jgi:AraC family transcriptional regulator